MIIALMLVLLSVQVDASDPDYVPPLFRDPPAQAVPSAPTPAAPAPDRRAVRSLKRRLEGLGVVYETMGRCTGSMSPDEVERVLRDAQANAQAGPFLLARFEKGFRSPRGDEWCASAMEKASARLRED